MRVFFIFYFLGKCECAKSKYVCNVSQITCCTHTQGNKKKHTKTQKKNKQKKCHLYFILEPRNKKKCLETSLNVKNLLHLLSVNLELAVVCYFLLFLFYFIFFIFFFCFWLYAWKQNKIKITQTWKSFHVKLWKMAMIILSQGKNIG